MYALRVIGVLFACLRCETFGGVNFVLEWGANRLGKRWNWGFHTPPARPRAGRSALTIFHWKIVRARLTPWGT